MNYRWFFAFSFLFFIAFFAINTSSTAFAQSIDRQTESNTIKNTQGTYSYFYDQGIEVLDSSIKSLEDAKTAVENAANEPKKIEIAATISKYIKIFQDEKTAYASSFNSAKNRGVGASDAQIQGNISAVQEFQRGFEALSVREKQEPRALGIVQTYNKAWSQLRTQAEQIKGGQITAGSAEANSLGNAAPIATAGTSAANIIKNNDTKECSLAKGNLLPCVDQIITWLIKNTLLQLAGFLAWLASSLLNYAIQISILDFSKWAPDSLYPLWIIVRQIISLIIVFSGLYLGFMYIIGREDTFGQYIGWLVIFALFVNFSYPITRALVDVSNIISLNVYSSAVGPETLDGSTGNTAGGLILNKLGLQGLIASATDVKSEQAGFIAGINSTPGALLAVVFVAYAAWVFFIATQIIAARTAILVFLIVASPLLLVDAVVPKLGEVAVKMRKIFVEQLIAAPVFMIMLALTLKFMDVFQKDGVLSGAGSTLSGLQASGSGDTIKTFFGILMMLIMLHIMLKVTKSVAGSAGLAATNMIGKVGGFGLGVASGGAGFLARGSIGAVAARARDSGWMEKMKESRTGRGLYSLTNSLAQSTFDTRNVGMISKGMAGAGMGMGAGLKMGYDQRLKAKEESVMKMGESIKDDATRANYFARAKTGLLTRPEPAKLRELERNIQGKRTAQMAVLSTADAAKRQSLIDQAKIGKDYVLQQKMEAGDAYLKVDNSSTTATPEKVRELVKMKDNKAAEEFIKNDPFTDLQKVHDEEMKKLQLGLDGMKRNTDAEKIAYNDARTAIGQAKKDHTENIEKMRKDLLDTYRGQRGNTGPTTPPPGPSASSTSPPNPPSPSSPQAPSSGSSAAPSAAPPLRPVPTRTPVSNPSTVTAAQNSNPLTIQPGPNGTYTFNGTTYASAPEAINAKNAYNQNASTAVTS